MDGNENSTKELSQVRALKEPIPFATRTVFMKCLDETAGQVASRMRQLATGLGNPADVEAIMRYASWLEANPESVLKQDLEAEISLEKAYAR